MSNKTLISIITPSFNQAQFIEKTILSVLDQDYHGFEHIVMDGGSTDGTIDILKKYPHLKWVSEKDHGQANAINKGFNLARGEILAWLNSDDYYEKNIFRSIVEIFDADHKCNFLYGDITYVSINDEIIRKITGDILTRKNLIINPDVVRQPSCFWRKSLQNKVGTVNENLNLVMDYDLFSRISQFTKFKYVERNFSYYRTYSNTKTLANQRQQVLELLKVSFKNNGYVHPRMIKLLFERYLNSFKSD